jgi:hypothetical protein
VTLLILSLFLGLGLLALLYLLITRSSAAAPEGSAQSLLAAHHALTRLQQSLLSPALVDRIFSDSDLQYVFSLESPALVQLFLRERRRLALLWVREVRSQILQLVRFHRSQSGFYTNLSFTEELSLTRTFWSLLLVCRSLQFLIYLRGPFVARAIAGRAVSSAGRFCDLAGSPIAFLSSYSASFSASGYPKAK